MYSERLYGRASYGRGRWQSGVLVPITGKYLRIGLNTFAGTSARHAADFPNVAEWVDSPVRATVDSAENPRETQRKLAELGIETHLGSLR